MVITKRHHSNELVYLLKTFSPAKKKKTKRRQRNLKLLRESNKELCLWN